MLLLAASKVDRLSNERINLIVIVISSELDVGLVVLLEECGGEIAEAERDVKGCADGCEVGLLTFLS